MINELERKPISLYDAKAKKLIGVFKSRSNCAKYIYRHVHNANLSQKVGNRYLKKKTLKYEGKEYAFRFPKDEHLQLLGDKEFVILNGYDIPYEKQISSIEYTNTPNSSGKIVVPYTKCRKVVKLDLEGNILDKYESVKDAIRLSKLPAYNIRRNLKGVQDTVVGQYIFKYLN